MDFDGMTPGTCENLLCWVVRTGPRVDAKGLQALEGTDRPNGVQEEMDEVPQDLRRVCLEIKDVSRDLAAIWQRKRDSSGRTLFSGQFGWNKID